MNKRRHCVCGFLDDRLEIFFNGLLAGKRHIQISCRFEHGLRRDQVVLSTFNPQLSFSLHVVAITQYPRQFKGFRLPKTHPPSRSSNRSRFWYRWITSEGWGRALFGSAISSCWGVLATQPAGTRHYCCDWPDCCCGRPRASSVDYCCSTNRRAGRPGLRSVALLFPEDDVSQNKLSQPPRISVAGVPNPGLNGLVNGWPSHRTVHIGTLKFFEPPLEAHYIFAP